MSVSPSIESRLRSLLSAVEIIHHHGQGAFQDRVMAACQHLFPECSNSYELWHRSDGSHDGAMNMCYDAKDFTHRFQRIGELVPLQNPLYKLISQGACGTLRLTDYISISRFRQTELFDIGFSPVDICYQVAIPLRNASHVGGITFNRDDTADFETQEMRLLDLFGRHLAVAHESDKVLAAAQAQRPVVESTDHLAMRRAGLTRRESEVLLWIAQGKRDREIAIILGISYRTVTNHVRAVLTKLGVETRTAAISAMQRR